MSSCAFFLYTRSNNVDASRRFYSELVGLDQIWDEMGDIAFVVGDSVQFSIGHDPNATVDSEWAFQPGWVFGLGIEPSPSRASASWSIPLSPESFSKAVARLQEADIAALRSEPFWVGYWSYVVKDPMGQTVELTDRISAGP
ncbi:VOC family protein [uncultured Arthrobacter sp.]|uniref:VOC family protein n=1 Tax=uncultured Arthrobacter sp. TaxID=114050 RepID=UPI00261DFADE|nr:VOC family protein [uncultured Arthrobacter sp.]